MIKKILLIVFTIISIFLFYLIFYKNERSDSSAEKITSSTQVPEKYLSGKELELYRILIEELRKTAEGEDNSCAYLIECPEPFESTDEYTKSLEKVTWFVKSYAPEYIFWADTCDFWVHDTTECTVLYFPSPEYMSGEDEITLIDRDKLAAANDAIAYAKRIAEKYEDKSDYAKVIGYAAEICSLNTYNDEAADTEGYARENIDPWRIVNVFDGDPRTNVVCGGYAQAFQYLCGLGGIECHYVCGDIEEGYHAWNIVVVNGVNYFADITTCDATGYSADDIRKRHPYVMNAVTKSTAEKTETALLTKNNSYFSINYEYDEKTREYLPADLRTVSEKPYRSKRELYFLMIGSLIGMVVCAIPSRKRSKEDEDAGKNENIPQ